MPNIANNNLLVQAKKFHSNLNADLNEYENVDQNNFYIDHKSSSDGSRDNNKTLLKSKSFFKNNKLISCIQSRSMKKTNNSMDSFCSDDESEEIVKSCITLKKSKLAKTLKSIFVQQQQPTTTTTSENDHQLNKLFEIFNPNILNQLDKIVNSPIIGKLIPFLESQSNIELNKTVRVADQVKKLNQLTAVQNKHFIHLEPKQPSFDLAKFKQELNAKLEIKKNNLDLKLPSLVTSSQKCVSSLDLLRKNSSHSQTSHSLSYLPFKQNELIAKDSIDVLRNKKTSLIHKEINFETSSIISSRISSSSSSSSSTDLSILKNLCEIFQNYDDVNNPLETMTYKQLLDNKFKLEQYLFKLDYEFGQNRLLLKNSLYLRLKKRHKLILVLLANDNDASLCNKCGRKIIV